MNVGSARERPEKGSRIAPHSSFGFRKRLSTSPALGYQDLSRLFRSLLLTHTSFLCLHPTTSAPTSPLRLRIPSQTSGSPTMSGEQASFEMKNHGEFRDAEHGLTHPRAANHNEDLGHQLKEYTPNPHGFYGRMFVHSCPPCLHSSV